MHNFKLASKFNNVPPLHGSLHIFFPVSSDNDGDPKHLVTVNEICKQEFLKHHYCRKKITEQTMKASKLRVRWCLRDKSIIYTSEMFYQSTPIK